MSSGNTETNFSVFGANNDDPSSQNIVFATLYSLIVLFGVVGNGIVIAIVRKTPSMHTTTNYLLVNLAVADLLSLLFCPGFYDFSLHDIRLKQTIGDFICKVFAGNAVLSVTVLESIFTLTVIAAERYFSLVKPFNTSARLKKENVRYAIAATWITAALICIPGFLSNNYDKNATKYPCNRPWTLDRLTPLKRTYIIAFCSLCIVTPTVVILFCYSSIFYGIHFKRNICSENSAEIGEKKSKKRLLKLLVSLAVAFAICCIPFAAFFIYVSLISQSTLKQNYGTLHLVHRLVRFFLILNSFINPLLYAAQSSNYRQGLRKLCRFRSRTRANESISSRALENHQELVELSKYI